MYRQPHRLRQPCKGKAGAELLLLGQRAPLHWAHLPRGNIPCKNTTEPQILNLPDKRHHGIIIGGKKKKSMNHFPELLTYAPYNWAGGNRQICTHSANTVWVGKDDGNCGELLLLCTPTESKDAPSRCMSGRALTESMRPALQCSKHHCAVTSSATGIYVMA